MQVYRISKTSFISDMTGYGARISGGRWNHKGTSLLYTSENRALASVEYLVHVPLAIIPNNLSIAIIDIPDKIKPKQTNISDLPDDWKQYPALNSLPQIGTDWATSMDSLLLRVPSVVVEDEYNILINPLHKDFNLIKIVDIKPYIYNDRLLRENNS